MTEEPTKSGRRLSFPDWLVWAVVGISFVPSLCRLFDVDFGVPHYQVGNLEADAENPTAVPPNSVAVVGGRGPTIHVLLEWTAVCIAGFSVVFAVAHYSIRRDVTTPIIAAALCFAGLVDLFRVLAILGLTENLRDVADFIPFTWALSRTYHAVILLAGTLPFVVDPRNAEQRVDRVTKGYLLIAGIAFLMLSYVLVHLCAIMPLPRGVAASAPVSRPWDVIPLLVYMVAIGFVLPRFHHRYPSLFAHGLVVSMVPNVLAQCHAAFGSRQLFDHDSVASQLLKIAAYLAPLCGLILDYMRAHESDVKLQTTQEKLRLARDVQQRLLPQESPAIDGYDVAGRSEPTEAVGGDYFDFPVDRGGMPGIVVGDVSGHELAASIVLAQTRAYLRAVATAHDEPAAMLTELNRFLNADVLDQWFVTMFYVRLEPETGRLTYVGAGHEARIVRADGTEEPLPSTCSPLGMMDAPPASGAEQPVLQPGDLLLVTSDGVNEAVDEANEQFGWPRAIDVAATNLARPTQDIVDAIFTAVEDFRTSPTPLDDITVVVLKRTLESPGG